MKQGQTTTPGISSPTLSDKCVGSLTSPANHTTLKMQETGPTVYSSYPRRPIREDVYLSHDLSAPVSTNIVLNLKQHGNFKILQNDLDPCSLNSVMHPVTRVATVI